MSQKRKNFIPRNDGFTCEQCGQDVGPARGTFRNHCPFCLTSKHVDDGIPGDRLSLCQGLMPTIKIEGSNLDELDLVQQCLRCDKTMVNRLAPDDNKELVFDIMRRNTRN